MLSASLASHANILPDFNGARKRATLELVAFEAATLVMIIITNYLSMPKQ